MRTTITCIRKDEETCHIHFDWLEFGAEDRERALSGEVSYEGPEANLFKTWLEARHPLLRTLWGHFVGGHPENYIWLTTTLSVCKKRGYILEAIPKYTSLKMSEIPDQKVLARYKL